MKRNVMIKAWSIAREAAAKFGGKAVEYIAEALRMAWAEARKPADITERVDELTRMGFNRWQKNGMDRMYINATTMGLTCTYYKTGNIHSATFQGYSVSNSEARGLKAAKTYIDLHRKQIVSDSCRLAAAVAEMIGAEYRYGDRIINL